jgi:methionyl-tRNA synthetase
VLWSALLAAPAIPGKAAAILEQLGLSPDDAGRRWPARWNQELAAGGRVARGAPLFPRIDEARQAELLARWIPDEYRADGAASADPPAEKARANANPSSRSAPAGSRAAGGDGVIQYDDFQKLELRVAVVTEAEKVPKADRLLRLKVDLGNGELRQVVAGIADAYGPDEVVGRRVIFLCNLAPRKIRGIESQGMILAAGDEQVLALSGLDREVPAGTRVR